MKRKDWTVKELEKLPKTKEEAVAIGSKYYYLSSICKRGHVSAIETEKNRCVQCRREDGLLYAQLRRRRLGIQKQRLIKPLQPGIRINNLVSTGGFERRHVKGKNQKYTKVYHEVKCDCGELFWVNNSQWGKQIQCRNCANQEKLKLAKKAQQGIAFVSGNRSNTIEASLLYAARKRALRSGIEFELSITDIKVPEYCPVLGFRLDTSLQKTGNRKPRFDAPSLDRINPKIGYIKGNVKVVSYRANNLKKDGTIEEHKAVASFLENDIKPPKNEKTVESSKLDIKRYRGKDNWTIDELKKLPKTRGDAVSRGENIYFSGRLCPKGHLSPRRIDGKCRACRNEQDTLRAKRLGLIREVPMKIDLDKLSQKDLPNSRKEAMQKGEKYYKPQKPCKNGHISPRDVRQGCIECKRDAGREAARKTYEKKGYNITGKTHTMAQFLYESAKQRAKRKSIEFSINIDDVVVPIRCPIFDLPLDISWGGTEQKNAERANTPSLDRIDPNKGYIKGNILVVSYRENMIKGNGSPKEHRAIAKYIEKEKNAYRFMTPEQLIADFQQDIERWKNENRDT